MFFHVYRYKYLKILDLLSGISEIRSLKASCKDITIFILKNVQLE